MRLLVRPQVKRPPSPAREIVVDGRPCSTARVDDPEKWAHRRQREPWPREDFADAAGEVLRQLVEVRREDPSVGDPYFEPGAKVVGVWGTGSGAAGRYNEDSDIDIWVQVEGLTHQGEKYADQDINEWLLEHERMNYAAGVERRIDSVVLDYPPPEQACRYDLTGDFQDEIGRFSS